MIRKSKNNDIVRRLFFIVVQFTINLVQISLKIINLHCIHVQKYVVKFTSNK